MKKLTSTLVCTLAMACMVLAVFSQTGAFAQTVPKPYVPEFTVKYADAPYSETYTDPYTGAQSAHFVPNRTIEVRIKNQPFTPYTNASGDYIGLYYNICSKGHFSNYWIERNGGSDNYIEQNYGSEYTVVPFYGEIPFTGTIDIQIEAIAGYNYVVNFGISAWLLSGEESGWSKIQTLSFSYGRLTNSEIIDPTQSTAPTTTPIQTVTPTTPPTSTPSPHNTTVNLIPAPVIILVILVVLGLVAAVTVLLLRIKPQKDYLNQPPPPLENANTFFSNEKT